VGGWGASTEMRNHYSRIADHYSTLAEVRGARGGFSFVIEYDRTGVAKCCRPTGSTPLLGYIGYKSVGIVPLQLLRSEFSCILLAAESVTPE
jgi:hypothetical protein